MKKLNANQIKYLLAALMVLDHLPHVPGLVPPVWEAIFHAVTRCVAAGFAYLAVEGFLHTRHLRRYQVRLWGAATIMAAGNWLLNSLLAERGVHISNNIFLTLALGVSVLALAFPRQSQTPPLGRCRLALLSRTLADGRRHGGTALYLDYLLLPSAPGATELALSGASPNPICPLLLHLR